MKNEPRGRFFQLSPPLARFLKVKDAKSERGARPESGRQSSAARRSRNLSGFVSGSDLASFRGEPEGARALTGPVGAPRNPQILKGFADTPRQDAPP